MKTTSICCAALAAACLLLSSAADAMRLDSPLFQYLDAARQGEQQQRTAQTLEGMTWMRCVCVCNVDAPSLGVEWAEKRKMGEGGVGCTQSIPRLALTIHVHTYYYYNYYRIWCLPSMRAVRAEQGHGDRLGRGAFFIMCFFLSREKLLWMDIGGGGDARFD